MPVFIRRIILFFILIGPAIMALTAPATSQEKAISAYDFSFPAIDGTKIMLDEFRGRPLLIVNTAVILRRETAL